MIEPCALSLSEMINQIRRGRLSPVALMESVLRRVDSLEPLLQAWVTIDRENALEEALRHQNEISRGQFRGPLHGIPIGVKDIFYTAGMKTTAGSKIFEDFVPDRDATAVKRSKKAGAIILGKTATTEFAAMDPASTRNPWNLAHTPGGSSSGSAVAVATSMCPAALGSQTGGSTLRPAAYCGVVGLKPTYGRISRHGIFAVSWTLDHVGVFACSVEDTAILLQVLAGSDSEDPTTSREPVSNYIQSIESMSKPPRIGIVRTFYEKNTQEQIWHHTKEVLSKLEKAGGRIEEVKMPESFSAVHDAHRIIMKVEAASFHQKLFEQHRDKYGPKIREVIEIGLLIPGVEYLQAQKIKRQFRLEMDEIMQRFDCLLTPATSTAAPKGLSSTGPSWYQVPWSLSGLPAISIPSGLSNEGLPLGIQLIGGAFAEGNLLAVARWCEKVLQVSLSPSLVEQQ
jgi:aspartyl-tRNA(Asn)/glutamyl-tRNA(Gln) amidotransferase subunit A